MNLLHRSQPKLYRPLEHRGRAVDLVDLVCQGLVVDLVSLVNLEHLDPVVDLVDLVNRVHLVPQGPVVGRAKAVDLGHRDLTADLEHQDLAADLMGERDQTELTSLKILETKVNRTLSELVRYH